MKQGIDPEIILMIMRDRTKGTPFGDHNYGLVQTQDSKVIDLFDQQLKRIKYIKKEIEAGDYGQISLAGNFLRPKSTDFLAYYYNQIPEEQRHEIIVDCYVHDGYNFPKRYIIAAKKYRPKDYLKELPEALKDKDPLTVYRATETTPGSQDLKNEISWTTDLNTALFFYCKRFIHGGRPFIYEGKIYKRDIIAYTNQRQEFEVIQHRKVFDITSRPDCNIISSDEAHSFLKKYHEKE